MILTFMIIVGVLFILALVFNDPLNGRFKGRYEDNQKEIAEKMFGEEEDDDDGK